MPKQVAVIAVNPVNGLGLFTYLEAFYEHKIGYKAWSPKIFFFTFKILEKK